MAPTTPNEEPDTIHVGDTLKFLISAPDYPASDGWVLKYYFQNATNAFQVSAAASGDAHLVAATAAWPEGDYQWTARAEKGTEKFPIRSGAMLVKPDLAVAGDQRSHAVKVLDALNALIEGKALRGDQQSYQIAGRSIARLSPIDLQSWQSYYQRKVDAERAKEARAQGKAGTGIIRTRFRK